MTDEIQAGVTKEATGVITKRLLSELDRGDFRSPVDAPVLQATAAQLTELAGTLDVMSERQRANFLRLLFTRRSLVERSVLHDALRRGFVDEAVQVRAAALMVFWTLLQQAGEGARAGWSASDIQVFLQHLQRCAEDDELPADRRAFARDLLARGPVR